MQSELSEIDVSIALVCLIICLKLFSEYFDMDLCGGCRLLIGKAE